MKKKQLLILISIIIFLIFATIVAYLSNKSTKKDSNLVKYYSTPFELSSSSSETSTYLSSYHYYDQQYFSDSREYSQLILSFVASFPCCYDVTSVDAKVEDNTIDLTYQGENLFCDCGIDTKEITFAVSVDPEITLDVDQISFTLNGNPLDTGIFHHCLELDENECNHDEQCAPVYSSSCDTCENIAYLSCQTRTKQYDLQSFSYEISNNDTLCSDDPLNAQSLETLNSTYRDCLESKYGISGIDKSTVLSGKDETQNFLVLSDSKFSSKLQSLGFISNSGNPRYFDQGLANVKYPNEIPENFELYIVEQTEDTPYYKKRTITATQFTDMERVRATKEYPISADEAEKIYQIVQSSNFLSNTYVYNIPLNQEYTGDSIEVGVTLGDYSRAITFPIYGKYEELELYIDEIIEIVGK